MRPETRFMHGFCGADALRCATFRALAIRGLPKGIARNTGHESNGK